MTGYTKKLTKEEYETLTKIDVSVGTREALKIIKAGENYKNYNQLIHALILVYCATNDIHGRLKRYHGRCIEKARIAGQDEILERL